MNGKRALRRCAEVLDLPAELVAGEMKIELTEGELYLARHQGLMSYSETLIDVNAGELIVRIRGENLQLLAMSEEELRIGGKLCAVELLR